MPAPDLSDLERRRDPRRAGRPAERRAPVRRAGRTARRRRSTTCSTLLRSFKERKLMRRFAAVMNHRSAGFKANAMGVWAVPDERLDAIGPQMAGFAAVSHCYRRPTYDDWPYSVFTMVHGRSARDCEATIDAIRDRDRRRRVLPAVVGEGVQEGARALLHARVGRVARPATSTATLDRGQPGALDTARLRRRRRRSNARRRRPASPTSSAMPRAAIHGHAGGVAPSVTRAGSPPRWCAAASSPRPSSGRSRRPTGARGTARTRAARRRGRSPTMHLQHPLGRFVRECRASAGAAAARRRPRARANRRPRRCRRRASDARSRRAASAAATSSTCTTCTGGAAPTHATGGCAAIAAARAATARPGRRPARSAAASRPGRHADRAHSASARSHSASRIGGQVTRDSAAVARPR